VMPPCAKLIATAADWVVPAEDVTEVPYMIYQACYDCIKGTKIT